MPYTPPQRSPASSAASTPTVSRRSSFNDSRPVHTNRPSLPRSSSYLARHKRALSAPTIGAAAQPTPRDTSEDLKGMVSVCRPDGQDDIYIGRSVCQSPPPVTGERQGMPSGAVLSPPESPHSSSDDEDRREGVRGRQIENTYELKQLHEAISQLPKQRRESSPSDTSSVDAQVSRRDLAPFSFSTSSLDQLARRSALIQRSGSSSGRRVSHVRSATEPNVVVTPAGGSVIGSDDENDLDMHKPPMVRKKSGELVRPALRFSTGRRPSSVPWTPTFSKAVHFDSHLEHVRHFLQVDRPLAVSAGSSPVDTYDSESEYPFNSSIGMQKQQGQRHGPVHEWEMTLTKFPAETAVRMELPARLERVWLSADQKCLHGSVAVANLAFSKQVVCRFTLDYWKTTSEVAAEYSAEIVPRVSTIGHDRFNFTIRLSDMAHLESKTLFFCIRYTVGGKEYWDNNGGSNFQVDFKKKMLPVNGKAGLQTSNGLPRSRRRASSSVAAPRPISMPASLDDFNDGANLMFDRSLQDYLGEPFPALRLKSPKSSAPTSDVPSDNLGSNLSVPSGLAFANRYDFSASLSAVMQAAKDSLPSSSELTMKPNRKLKVSVPKTTFDFSAAAPPSLPAKPVVASKERFVTPVPAGPTVRDVKTTQAPNAAAAAAHGQGSIASKSYDEIVSKYCFVGQINGAAGEVASLANSTPPSSSEGSPILMGGGLQRHPATALRHSMSGSWGGLMIRGQQTPFSPPPTSADLRQYQLEPRLMASAPNSRSSSSAGSPGSMIGVCSPLDSPSADLAFQHMQDRFPFNSADAHSATAIRG
ncbi:protein phosphatase regulatory subunit [Grosmannia clavigera kw1407]|uniref:Protein phosphatase regulatory subunit n=1 Tax=Grosmannia clavigera (strain kw1407 / UAMH 11150) TaxID=655863 RepID=F0XNK0_GROCL|nr:protein phosphatase regulatory subunit [Grosmannia clavigera kw1407]EFX00296.1 protein phosphatase regulatory subunit [Grosmannia clavigera kw1407]